MSICLLCTNDSGYITEGGKLPICQACRDREGIGKHPAQGQRVPLSLVRPLYEDDEGSPIEEDTLKGRER